MHTSTMTSILKVMILVFCGTLICQGQDNYEREFRIKKSQFPDIPLDSSLAGHNIKRKRFYKEVDSLGTNYILKFKKDRLHYALSFDKDGTLKKTGFRVNEVDIPDETFLAMENHLSASFNKFSIKRIYQQYSIHDGNDQSILTSTFQNLLLPSIIYKLVVIGKKDGIKNEYDFWFNAEGHLINKRIALPMNHDHILY
ncbi:hypothetical protein HZY62_07285 [Maribacter polysiphoniae]|uniref:Uncharacterized protein n=1 Tax=Maribacter polysiphoniae TaxID=429344 RepID=A0A316E905_9FLAO|nr:hypothetical protein [Maribacter polysiphoniae]MBD1260385.1 hypothetical protein [Maribacter polysiphoniae]PWK25849.1 hypothetical protein LX92_00593 [Maribacter polysiphoniae]